MKRPSVALIVFGVLAAHVVFFWLVADAKVLPQRPYFPPPNFGAREAHVVDMQTGEKLIYREFTVSTKLESK